MRVLQFELFQGGGGAWTLAARFQPRDEATAKARAEANWTQNRIPTILTQETAPEDGGESEVSVVYRSPESIAGITPPDPEADMSGGIAGAVIGGILIGIVLGLFIGMAAGSILLGLLAAVTLSALGVMVLFRMAAPPELVMWRNKPAETRHKTVAAIVAVAGEDAPRRDGSVNITHGPTVRRKMRKGAFSHPVGEQRGMTGGGMTSGGAQSQASREAPVPGVSAAQLLEELIAKQIGTLSTFTADALSSLGAQANALQAFDRYGINLYVAGAAQELAWREALTEATMQSILISVLTEQGQNAEAVKSFCERLDGALDRPRYKAMLDAGRAAMIATMQGLKPIDDISLPVVLKTWSNPHDKAALARKYAVLLTDLIGSTDATRKLGNAGAQRMLRAHNAIIRNALKDNRGTEVKHTGDGILAIFDKPADAVEAGRAIQQDANAYVRENPDVPLLLRIGIEYGDGSQEGGEYFGPAFSAIEATCDAAGGGDIAVTALVKDKSSGADRQFAPLTPSPTAKSFVPGLFKLLWDPKRATNIPPLEYRQLGSQ
jgi:adenylate cyclase